MPWGILAPDTVISQRRQQSLELAAAVRHFNDRAVPGLGGMWFPMPILWSVLAVSIAEELGQPALPVGNAVEALMMKQATETGRSRSDRRVRGVRKLQGLKDWSFRSLTRRGTYVIQPIRMAMVQPLVALSFVQGNRYGAFRTHHAGKRMLELPEIKDCRRLLGAWARGENLRDSDLSKAIQTLSPTARVPDAIRKLIQAQLIGREDTGSIRRRNLVFLESGPSAEQLNAPKPLPGIDPDHWADLRTGAAFMDLRDAALAVLDLLEKRLLDLRDGNKPARLPIKEAAKESSAQIERLHHLARIMDDRIKTNEAEPSSRAFLSEVLDLSVSAPENLLKKLAERDGSVIIRHEDYLRLGPAADDDKTGKDPGTETKPPRDKDFAPQLFRLYNLHCLAAELKGNENPGCKDVHNPVAE